MAEMKAVRFTARDGLEIPAYLAAQAGAGPREQEVRMDVQADEAHGYFSLANRVEFYSKLESFLKQNVGPVK